MSGVFDTDLGAILDHYSDVIEGGNSYSGGTVYKGIPGQYPNDKYLRNGDDSTQTVVGASVSTTTFDVAAGDWDENRWVSDSIPPLFATSPDDETRKIVGWDVDTKVFTVAPALSAAPSAADEMAIRQGFKRLPNKNDIESDDTVGQPDGWDRYFHLMANPGAQIKWYGDGYYHYKTEMVLRLRIGKHGRLQDWAGSLITNFAIMRSVLPRQELYPATGVKVLIALEDQEPEIAIDDDRKIVMFDRYELTYTVDGTYK